MKITVETESGKWVAIVQNDTAATICNEYDTFTATSRPYNTYAIATNNLPREIRRVMGSRGISVPAEPCVRSHTVRDPREV